MAKNLANSVFLSALGKSLGGEIPDNVCQVTTPEGSNSLLTGNTGEAVDNTGVTGDFSTDDFGVGVLGLDEELDTLDGGSACFGDGSGDTTGEEVNHKIRHGGSGRVLLDQRKLTEERRVV